MFFKRFVYVPSRGCIIASCHTTRQQSEIILASYFLLLCDANDQYALEKWVLQCLVWNGFRVICMIHAWKYIMGCFCCMFCLSRWKKGHSMSFLWYSTPASWNSLPAGRFRLPKLWRKVFPRTDRNFYRSHVQAVLTWVSTRPLDV